MMNGFSQQTMRVLKGDAAARAVTARPPDCFLSRLAQVQIMRLLQREGATLPVIKPSVCSVHDATLTSLSSVAAAPAARHPKRCHSLSAAHTWAVQCNSQAIIGPVVCR